MKTRPLHIIYIWCTIFWIVVKTHELKQFDICRFKKGILEILKNHVRHAKHLDIKVLFYTPSANMYPAVLEPLYNIYQINKPLQIKTYYLHKKTYQQRNYFKNKPLLINHKTEACPDKKLFRTSFAKKKVIFILGETLDLIINFFVHYSSRKTSNYLHVILLTQDQDEEYVALTLKILWDTNKWLNVILYKQCTLTTKQKIYIYRPFQFYGNKYGVVQSYNIYDVRNCPYFLLNHVKNLNGHPLNISIFFRNNSALENLPKMLKDEATYLNIANTSQVYGTDGILTSEISVAMNFKIIRSSKSKDFGYELANGSVIESAGEVVRREVELQGNPRFLALNFHLKGEEYTTYFSHDKICVVVRKSELMPKWIKPFLEIKFEVWVLIIVSMTISVILNNLFKHPKARSMSLSFLEIFGTTFSQACLITSGNGPIARRLFLSCFLFATLCLSNWFAGIFYTSFTSLTYFPDIMTLEQLLETDITMENSLYAFKGSPRDLYQRLDKRACKANIGLSDLDRAVSDRHHAALDRLNDLNILIRSKYIREDGSPLLHIIPECPSSYFLALIVPRGSPFLLEINLIISKLRESGFDLKWYNDFAYAIIMEQLLKGKDIGDRLRPLDLENTIFAFQLILQSYFFCILIFIGELVFAKLSIFLRPVSKTFSQTKNIYFK